MTASGLLPISLARAEAAYKSNVRSADVRCLWIFLFVVQNIPFFIGQQVLLLLSPWDNFISPPDFIVSGWASAIHSRLDSNAGRETIGYNYTLFIRARHLFFSLKIIVTDIILQKSRRKYITMFSKARFFYRKVWWTSTLLVENERKWKKCWQNKIIGKRYLGTARTAENCLADNQTQKGLWKQPAVLAMRKWPWK